MNTVVFFVRNIVMVHANSGDDMEKYDIVEKPKLFA